MKKWRMIDSDTHIVGMGALELNVQRAREMGLTDNEIDNAWRTLSMIWLSRIEGAAQRAGRTERCRICECWSTPGKCMHCEAGHYVALPPPQPE